MSRLVIISNRLPVSIERRRGGLAFQQSVGGLATGLSSFYKKYESLWIGWPGIVTEKAGKDSQEIKSRLLDEFACHPVFLSKRDIDLYYSGFCNNTIWPLFHYFPQHTNYDPTFWKSYERVNELFCDVVAKTVREDDIIWVHDYQLMLLPRMLRERLPEAMIGYFLHIPFPSFEMFRLLPWRNQLLSGQLGADLIGFHTYDYALNFLKSSQRLLGYESSMGQITSMERIIKVDAFPMGIEYGKYFSSSENPKVRHEIEKLKKTFHGQRIILSIDRLDYSKGIVERLEAYSAFLDKNPEYRGKVVCILVAVPSRSQVKQYMELKCRIDELIGKINGRHGTIGWTPIQYLYKSLPFHMLTALYNIADVSLITPLRDGMNLIAKEYVSAKRDGNGVLILSEMAGAAKELGEAIIVNPNNTGEMAEALKKALEMPEGERKERMLSMQKRIERYNVVRWAEEFVNKLKTTKKIQEGMHANLLTSTVVSTLESDYMNARRRLFLLDYDGTLVRFFGRPEEAEPDEDILGLLKSLSEEERNEVVLISGRDRHTLARWFGNLDIRLVSEHGAWVKEKGSDWSLLEPITNEWKGEIRSIIELHVDRTPGSFIEEKEFSLAFHYRKSDPEIGSLRASELKEHLLTLTGNRNLQVLEGKKVIDVKNMEINKGHAAAKWLAKEDWDFVLCVGDDWTDEDMFGVMPPTAYSIRVGLSPTTARYNMKSSIGVTLLLKRLAKGGK